MSQFKVGRKVRRKVSERYENSDDDDYWTATITKVVGGGMYRVLGPSVPEGAEDWTWHESNIERVPTKLELALK